VYNNGNKLSFSKGSSENANHSGEIQPIQIVLGHFSMMVIAIFSFSAAIFSQ
jgi:hypothetical protein